MFSIVTKVPVRTVELPAGELPVGTITVDGFEVDYRGVVRQGQVAYRGVDAEGKFDTRVWWLSDLVPVRV